MSEKLEKLMYRVGGSAPHLVFGLYRAYNLGSAGRAEPFQILVRQSRQAQQVIMEHRHIVISDR